LKATIPTALALDVRLMAKIS